MNTDKIYAAKNPPCFQIKRGGFLQPFGGFLFLRLGFFDRCAHRADGVSQRCAANKFRR